MAKARVINPKEVTGISIDGIYLTITYKDGTTETLVLFSTQSLTSSGASSSDDEDDDTEEEDEDDEEESDDDEDEDEEEDDEDDEDEDEEEEEEELTIDEMREALIDSGEHKKKDVKKMTDKQVQKAYDELEEEDEDEDDEDDED